MTESFLSRTEPFPFFFFFLRLYLIVDILAKLLACYLLSFLTLFNPSGFEEKHQFTNEIALNLSGRDIL